MILIAFQNLTTNAFIHKLWKDKTKINLISIIKLSKKINFPNKINEVV